MTPRGGSGVAGAPANPAPGAVAVPPAMDGGSRGSRTSKPAASGPDASRGSPVTGIVLMVAAVSMFACLDTTAKYLGRELPVVEIVWARYTFATLLTLLIANPASRPGMLRTRRPFLQVVRAAILLATTLFNFLALRYLRLDQVLSITFATPFLVAALSGPVLGERVEPRRWAAIGVGFLGVLVVVRPGVGSAHPAVIFAVLAMLCYAVFFVTTRVLARGDTSDTTLFYSNLFGAVIMLPVAPWLWTAPAPWQWGLMVLAGALGSLGHWMVIAAHRHAPASLLSSFVYSQLIAVTILGFVVFGDTPDAVTLAGAALVIASGLYMLQRERARRRDEPRGG